MLSCARRALCRAGTGVGVPSAGGKMRRMHGVVVSWHPFERRGVIRGKPATTAEDSQLQQTSGSTGSPSGEGELFTISSSRAFESVLPTMLRSLDGAHVEFTVSDDRPLERTIVHSRSRGVSLPRMRRDAAEVTDPTYSARARIAQGGNGMQGADTYGTPSTSATTASSSSSSTAVSEEPSRFAMDIIVDFSTVAQEHLKRSAHHPTQTSSLGDDGSGGSGIVDSGLQATFGSKDLRPRALFDVETLDRLRRRKQKQQLCASTGVGDTDGDAKAKRDAAAEEEEEKEVELKRKNAVQRTALHEASQPAKGVVVAWSAIHRSGLIAIPSADGEITAEEAAREPELRRSFVIKNVNSFESAMPTAVRLSGREVSFVGAVYSNQPNVRFAEQITVLGDYNLAPPTADDDSQTQTGKDAQASQGQTASGGSSSSELERLAPTKGRRRITRQHHLDAMSIMRGGTQHPSCEEEDDQKETKIDASNVEGAVKEQEEGAAAEVFGVVTRWSGGQGSIEASNGKLYYAESAADFEEHLVDGSTGSGVRGAVVVFGVDAKDGRYARKIRILSLSSTEDQQNAPAGGTDTSKAAAHTSAASRRAMPKRPEQENASTSGGDGGADVDAVEDDLQWLEGHVATWSKAELQGVIQGDDGDRYVLRDVHEHGNVIDSKQKVQFLKKHRRVRFTPYGSNGRLACNVIPLDVELSEEEAAAAEGKVKKTEPKPSEEALAPPSASGYWMDRIEKAGIDVSDARKFQKKRMGAASPQSSSPQSDNPFDGDCMDAVEKEPWFNDNEKNIKVPGTDQRIGDMMRTSPISMLNLAVHTQDPADLQKTKEKYFNKMTPQQQEFAMSEAKKHAPLLADRLRQAKRKGEEATFYFN